MKKNDRNLMKDTLGKNVQCDAVHSKMKRSPVTVQLHFQPVDLDDRLLRQRSQYQTISSFHNPRCFLIGTRYGQNRCLFKVTIA